MAKVMISLPDDLLERVDVEARRRDTSRSAVLREFARDAFDRRDSTLVAQMRALNAQARGHGGGVASLLKSSRPR